MKINHITKFLCILAGTMMTFYVYAQSSELQPSELKLSEKKALELKPLILDPKTIDKRNLKFILDGKLQNISSNQLSADLLDKKTIIERVADKPKLIKSSKNTDIYSLPYSITQITTKKLASGEKVPVPAATFQPYIKVKQAFHFDSAEMAHLAKVALYIVKAGEQSLSTVNLPDPVIFTMAAENAVKIEPDSVRLSKTNRPESINVIAESPGEKFNLKVLSAFNPDGDLVPIKRMPFDMEISISKSTILGRGLETSDLYITIPPRALNGTQASVSLSVENGSAEFEQTRLSFDQTGTVGTKIRSIGSGGSKIVAHLQPFDEVRYIEITYQEIWRWLVWVIVGALLGAILGRLKQKKPQSINISLISLLIGVISGVMATFAYSQGLLSGIFNVPTIAAEIGAFTISFLFALFPQRFFRAAGGGE